MIFKIVFLVIVIYVVCVVFKREMVGAHSFPTSVDRSHHLMPTSVQTPLERFTYSANFSTQQSPFNVYNRDCDGNTIDLKLLNGLNTDVVLLQRFKNDKLKMTETGKKFKFVSNIESESNFNWLLSTDKGLITCAIGIQARQSITVEKYTHHTLADDTTLSVLVRLKGKPLVLSSSVLKSGAKTLSNIHPLMEHDGFTGYVVGIHLDTSLDGKPTHDDLIKSIGESLPKNTCIFANSEMDLVLLDMAHKYDQLNDGISPGKMGTLVTFYTSLTTFFENGTTEEFNSNLTESISRAVCID